MQTTIEFLDALKAKTGAASDYALAKKMGVTRSGISSYRTGRSFFDDEMCLKVASILEIEPFLVLAAVHAERAKTAREKSAWEAAFKRFGGIAAAVFMGVTLQAPSPADAGPAQTSGKNNPNTVYYVKSRRRKNGPLGMLLLNLFPPPKYAG